MATTPLTFMDLLTDAEQATVTAAAMQNPQLMLWMLKLAAAQEIDLDDPRTQAGLDAMVAGGLLSQDRVDAITSAARYLVPKTESNRVVGVKDGLVTSAVMLSTVMQIAPDRTFAAGFNEQGGPVAYKAPDGGLLYEHAEATIGWSFDPATQTFTPPAIEAYP